MCRPAFRPPSGCFHRSYTVGRHPQIQGIDVRSSTNASQQTHQVHRCRRCGRRGRGRFLRDRRARPPAAAQLPLLAPPPVPAAAPAAGDANARSRPRPRGWSSEHGQQPLSTSGFSDRDMQRVEKVTVKEAFLHDVPEQDAAQPRRVPFNQANPSSYSGRPSSTTITATQVTVQPAGSEGRAASSAARVVPFQRRAPATSKTGRSDPGDYTQGSGTHRHRNDSQQGDGSCARLPGGIVDRVVGAEQRRLRGPLHRRQLAAPHLRQPGLQGHRRQRPDGYARTRH